MPHEEEAIAERIRRLRVDAGALTIRETIDVVDADPVAIRDALSGDEPWERDLADAVIDGLLKYIERKRSRLLRALCCDCGMLRALKCGYRGRRAHTDAVDRDRDPDHLAEMQSRGLYTGVQPYWRHIRVLKCSECRDWTQHALILDGQEEADDAELLNYGIDAEEERLQAWRRERASDA